MKTIVPHVSVDLDAVTSSWLVVRYMPGWTEAGFNFVPAGTTLNGADPDEDLNIIHVDTGLGKFDHHQFADNKLSATKRVFDYLQEKSYVKKTDLPALSRIVEFVTLIDNFGEVYFPDPTSDIYDFSLYQLTEGLKQLGKKDEEVVRIMFTLLDATLELFKKKINAEDEVKKGYIFKTKWGKSLALETQNEEALKYALKQGYKIVARRNPKKGFVRIKSAPEKEIDLTPVHEEIVKKDPSATWFLHSSKHMLLNGSSKNPTAVASNLPLKKVVEILQSIA
ncbi:hypothetical protein A3G67_03410 [Candidatus Roizmanbacteria bacterium RIFCSPLOWO2_12_FULL_40_12]|uniref:Uncharacterized protein n=1 Tax=Candidatus Roizmanbacteria bacterium RIFCSPLOWO2_01_FULL_40_42 TaxID=1802066 RepID=A0A1F7J5I3_9BACT|nr:MAG: hypothetical protein A2779_03045 [Candidatus Roizmanbacteria bacterium RIFCSPHIGHO2_01_FULL_40_98]OGK28318.1 MAG: hypothetical protein A3C31_00410 [Candidatus Roizmanbacteria bacterium RIFCSPHIGHO2_02_FULL_40_53]OGK30554.1 MAG: hypothetical protein A2W49_03095 [Candidatus Roizmanbacteria bacterium RIFCSPHIGHO2_12_41_18]OGK36968.1 MAG: hypothetical protein A3E69_00670 [Candidatus Roizmanbacteria bacterium RIFCSPHIGHO2_12_FULL_40_130]OGK50874.1 MAG: hypothetical protein A3B50_01180 [Candi